MKNAAVILIAIQKNYNQMKQYQIYSSLLTKEQNFSGTLMYFLLNMPRCLFDCWYICYFYMVALSFFFSFSFVRYCNKWRKKTTLFWCPLLIFSSSLFSLFHLISFLFLLFHFFFLLSFFFLFSFNSFRFVLHLWKILGASQDFV